MHARKVLRYSTGMSAAKDRRGPALSMDNETIYRRWDQHKFGRDLNTYKYV